ncbi:olfactory receptor 10Q1-like isoform X2 [Hemicordylus capensis]|uniref:olfactory receptor 10Q1-like isoform X2 n=1 Tax=Hemicordylus capensis TaxID=884348 RepID=UPI002303D4C4|nr:olfactory receptor 10Q1-like isoform X2 [Hemicordylus capensis]
MEKASLTLNNTTGEFIMLGFSNLPEYEVPLFWVFLAMYLVTLSGHLTIVAVTLADPILHTPMYFFLRNLSSIEICYTLVIVPKMLANFLAKSQNISLPECAVQMYLFIALGTSECFLLTVMAYDRYVAICNPLRYTLIMSRALCLQLVVVVYTTGFILSLGITVLIFRLPFCSSHEINHFFCDIPPVLFLACSDTHTDEILVFVACLLALLVPFLLILISYVFITNSILRIKGSEGRKKAFSTCAAHLVVAVLHYGCAIFIYIRPKASYSLDKDKVVSLIYTNVTPMLYPMIYSLRNKEVKGSLRKVMRRKVSFKKKVNF